MSDVDNLFVVGRGVGFAVAQEAALKLKETSGIHAEAMSSAELMHGPWTLAGDRFPILVLSQRDETLSGVNDLVTRLNGHAFRSSSRARRKGRPPSCCPRSRTFIPVLAPIALIQSFYPLVNAIAHARGRNPDNPPRLLKVTETV